jgi:hypothetical protein
VAVVEVFQGLEVKMEEMEALAEEGLEVLFLELERAIKDLMEDQHLEL